MQHFSNGISSESSAQNFIGQTTDAASPFSKPG